MNIDSFCRLILLSLFPCTPFLWATNPLFIPPSLSGTEFELTVDESTTEFYEGFATTTWGYNQSCLGPTLIWDHGTTVNLSVTNDLSETITTHWHGVNIDSPDDGGPHSLITPGETWSVSTYIYDTASTMWYHPHVHGLTASQVGMGLAGMILIRDDEEAGLGLPVNYGVDEFPVILQDRLFDEDYQLDDVGDSGDVILVNATVDPELDVPAQVVRFRFLNGSSERFYYLGLSDNRNFHVVGRDGGLFDASVAANRMLLAPGQRADILLDLGDESNNSLAWMSYASELPRNYSGANGNAPGALSIDGTDLNLLLLSVGDSTDEAVTSIPTTLAAVTPLTEAEADVERVITMDLISRAGFVMDNLAYDPALINYTSLVDDIEIWTITNNTNLAHPFHVHLVQFFLLDRDGETPAALKDGHKMDTVVIDPDETVRIIMDMANFGNPTVAYMYHCHILTHEDSGMMGQFIVVDTDSPWLEFAEITGGAIELCWSGNLQEFDLQKATTLEAGDADFADVSEVDITVNDAGDYEYTESIDSSAFYRLEFAE